MNNEPFRTINDRPIFWASHGVIHQCEGAEVHRGIRLLWTLCEIDVPADTAFHPDGTDSVTCVKCQALATKEPQS